MGTTRTRPHSLLSTLWLLTASSHAIAQQHVYRDADFDGLDDATEHTLLQRHRPILVFEDDERHWPISVQRFVTNSRLLWRGDESEVVAFSRDELSADPRRALDGHTRVPDRPSATFGPGGAGYGALGPGGCTCRSDWFLDLDDSLRGGVYPQHDGRDHEGMYGHVVPVDDNRILIQYWQLFPHNEAEQVSDCGDHEGDWCWIDVYVGRAAPHELLEIVYHHHGRECPSTSLPFPGVPNPLGGWLRPPVDLPSDGIPICYLEEQAHEWWPWASGGGECVFSDLLGFPIAENPSHHGNGICYRVPPVENIGERYAPMPGSLAAELLLRFNGRWGAWGAYCDFFFDAHLADPPNSPLHQSFPAPPGLDQFPPPPQVVTLMNAQGGNAVAVNNCGIVLTNENYQVGGRSQTFTYRNCLNSFGKKPFQRVGFSVDFPDQSVAHAKCLSDDSNCSSDWGLVGGTFVYVPGSTVTRAAIWHSPSTITSPGWTHNPDQCSCNFSITSIHSNGTGCARGEYGAIARYQSGLLVRLSATQMTGIPDGMTWYGGGPGKSNSRGEFIGYLRCGGRNIAARVNEHNQVTALESCGYPSFVRDIDEDGNVVGEAQGWSRLWPASNPAAPINLWQGGQANCINDHSQVGGLASSALGAYLWWGSGSGQLLSLIHPDARPFRFHEVVDLNNNGWALVRGNVSQGDTTRGMLVDTRRRSHVTSAAPLGMLHREVLISAITSGIPVTGGRWHRNGRPLHDGPTDRGSIVSGATTSQLRISSLAFDDAGYYQFAGSDLSQTLAEPAFLSIRCGADFDGDDAAGVGDIFAFLVEWFAAEPRADVNQTGGTPDLGDLFEFLSLWFSGC